MSETCLGLSNLTSFVPPSDHCSDSLGLAKTLMDDFENLCIKTYDAYFVDLFVRVSNKLAQGMYEKFGYSTCKLDIFILKASNLSFQPFLTPKFAIFTQIVK
jgi:hypothetical protein